MNARIRFSVLVAWVLTVSMSACSKDPTYYDPNEVASIPVTAATVQAVAIFITPASTVIQPNCLATIRINCATGAPGEAVYMAVAAATPEVAELSEGYYSFSNSLSIVVPSLLVTIAGQTCKVTINTGSLSVSPVRMSGTAAFRSFHDNADTNVVQIDTDVSGLTEDHVVPACGTRAEFVEPVRQAIAAAFQGDGIVCGSPGPPLLKDCPPLPAHNESRRRPGY